jgi:hypothetical protein
MKAPLLLLEARLRVIRRRIERLLAEHVAMWNRPEWPTQEWDQAHRALVREASARLEFFGDIYRIFYRLAWEGGAQ